MITPEKLAASNTEAGHQKALFCWIAQSKLLSDGYKSGLQIDVRGEIVYIPYAFFGYLQNLFAIPNGGYRNASEAANLKSQGVKAGVPDLMLPVACGQFHGLFIEMKRPKEIKQGGVVVGTQSIGRIAPAQKEWHASLRNSAYVVHVCYSWIEARDCLLEYLLLGNAK